MVSTYGTKKLPELFAPAIKLARDGYSMIEFNVEEFNGGGSELSRHATLAPAFKANYIDGIEGGTPKLGAVLKQPDLAKSYRAMAKDGMGSGMAMKDGKSVSVALDFKGNVVVQ